MKPFDYSTTDSNEKSVKNSPVVTKYNRFPKADKNAKKTADLSVNDFNNDLKKKVKFIDNSRNFVNLADKSNLDNIPDTVISTIGMYPMIKNNQESNTALETELRYGVHDPKKLQEMALDTGRYAPIDFAKLTDGGDLLLNASYDKLAVPQDFDADVKDAGAVFTFKSAIRKNNLDYSEHIMPPQKTYGRGIGDVETINDTYLGDESRVNNYDVRGYEYVREQELPADYFVVNRSDFPIPFGGIDTRYLNYKNARSKNVVPK
jgi:hypothetical protein